MKLRRLHLLAFGPFSGEVLDFGADGHGIVVVHGANEAGKSSAMRAVTDLRFGIPMQSTDNFVHEHPDMRIGGEFIDEQGASFSLIRRKGRNATLSNADFARGVALDTVVSPDVEVKLTGGLSRVAYGSMFSLDHAGLREGGEALLKGEGDLGAALFEVSAGVLSIPSILTSLDGAARKIYLPRAKNGSINESLRIYDEQHSKLRHNQVRPSRWGELFKSQQEHAKTVADLERQAAELHAKLVQHKELRGVAPLLSALDHGLSVLEELASAPLLSADAAAERAVAEAGHSAAKHNAQLAADEEQRQQAILEALTVDEGVLALGAAIQRLLSTVEAVEQHALAIAEAQADADAAADRAQRVATAVAPGRSVEALIGLIPSKTQRATIDAALKAFELAQHDLQRHDEAAAREDDDTKSTLPTLPTGEVRSALRFAYSAAQRAESDIRRREALPAAQKSAQRSLVAALGAVGLEAQSVAKVRPLLDDQIDAALADLADVEARRKSTNERVEQAEQQLETDLARLAELMEAGAVATRDDVLVARAHRDAGWALIEGTYISQSSPDAAAYRNGQPLNAVYVQAVQRADTLVDQWASDTLRASEVQRLQQDVQSLRAKLEQLKGQSIDIEAKGERAAQGWSTMLMAANLPSLPPGPLRSWQGLLPAVKAAGETVATLSDELEQLEATERGLANELRSAISATGQAEPSTELGLRNLMATAAEIESEFQRCEAAINQAEGEATQRARQRQQMSAKGARLAEAFNLQQDAFNEVLADVLLERGSSAEVLLARLAELDALDEARSGAADALQRRDRATVALDVVTKSCSAIWTRLGDPEPIDLRIYSETLASRLETAQAAERTRTLARQSIDKAQSDQRSHESTAALHEDAFAALCRAAGVDAASGLPEAELRSQRKRDAQAEVDRSRAQLAVASGKQIDVLRALLIGLDVSAMDADEAQWERERSQVTEELQAARQREEDARKELETIDASDEVAASREAMEIAAASIRTQMPFWVRNKVAHGLLSDALKRFREHAQGPMLSMASQYFSRMTRGSFARLLSDDSGAEPTLLAQRSTGANLEVSQLSEGTRDQLYLALRLAALDLRRESGLDLPVILDDVFMTSDESRSAAIFQALAEFAQRSQVVVFTHHRHVAEVAQANVPPGLLVQVSL